MDRHSLSIMQGVPLDICFFILPFEFAQVKQIVAITTKNCPGFPGQFSLFYAF